MLYHLTLEFTRATEAEDPYAFATGRQSYLLREAGGVYDGFEIDWDQALLDDLSALARPAPPAEVVTRMGDRLRRILRLAGWESTERELAQAARRGDAIVIDMLSAAAELYSLPWELVPIRAAGVALAELPGVLLRYTWPATVTVGPPVRPEGGHILFAWSDAADPVPWREQERTLREAVARAAPLAPITLEVLPRATPARLAEALTRRPTLLHLLCHGRSGPTGGLVLTGDDAYEAILDTARLRSLLAPYAQDLRQVVLCACGSGAWSAVASPLGSLAQTVHRLGVPSVVAFRFPVTQVGANQATEALYVGILNMFKSMEQALGDARAALRGGHSLDWAALQLYARAEDGLDTRPVPFRPYRGLLPFGAEHRPYFFGRERVIGEVCDELDQLVQTPGLPDLLFLSGPSGVGKSSLLAAGVLPRLRARWPGLQVVGTRPGATPLATLEAAVAGLKPGPALLVLDQLEELFTLGATAEDRAAWATRLWAILQSGVRCLAAIRGDYLDRLGEIPLPDGRRLDAIAYDDAHRAFIPRLQPEEMRSAIARPAEVVGLALEPGLAERILGDVGGEPGALPLMQHALDQLWQRREGRALTLRAYEQDIGGVDGALSRHADQVVGALDPADQTLARRLLTELVRWPGEATLATRVRLALPELARRLSGPARLDAVAAALTDARLLVRDGDGDGTTLEIAHEALIRRWPALQGWLKEGAEARSARDWLEGLAAERARDPGFVLRGAQLGAAVEARRRFGAELPADLLQFIEASERATAEAQRKARRRVRWTVGISLSAAVVMGLIGWYALRARDQAEEARQRATEETIRARDRGLMAAMRSVPETDELTRALLLREVEHVDETIGWWEAASTVAYTYFPRQLFTLKDEDQTLTGWRDVTWTRSGKRIVAREYGSRMHLLSPRDEPTIIVDQDTDEEQPVRNLTSNQQSDDEPDRAFLTQYLSPHRGTEFNVWSDLGRRYLHFLPSHTVGWGFSEQEAVRVDILPDGRRAAIIARDGVLEVLDLMSDARYLLTSVKPTQDVSSVAIGPKGAIAMLLDDGQVVLWRSTTRESRPEFLQTAVRNIAPISDQSFSRDGHWLALAGQDPDVVQLWPLHDVAPPPLISVPEGGLVGTAFSPESDALYVTTSRGVWRSALGDPTTTLPVKWQEVLVSPFQDESDESLRFAPKGLSLEVAPKGDWMMLSSEPDSTFDGPIEAYLAMWGRTAAIAHLRGYNFASNKSLSPEGTHLTGIDASGRIGLWDLSSPMEPRVHLLPYGSFNSVSPDGRWAWSVHEEAVDIVDLVGELSTTTFKLNPEWGGPGPIERPGDIVQASLDGKRVLLLLDRGSLEVWDRADATTPKIVEVLGKQILWASFWGDADHVVVHVAADQTQQLVVLDLRGQDAPDLLATLDTPPQQYWSAANQSWILGRFQDGYLRRWRVGGANASECFFDATGLMHVDIVSEDGAWIGSDGVPDLNSTEYRSMGKVLELDEACKEIDAMPIERVLGISGVGSKAAYFGGGRFSLIDLKSGTERNLALDRGWFDSGRFSADGHTLVLSTQTHAVVLTLDGSGAGRQIRLGPVLEPLKWIGFSPDGRRVIGLTEHYRYSWLWQPEDLKDWLWRATPYCLPPDERSTLLGENPEDASAHHAACVEKAREAQATSVEQPG